MTPLAQAGAPDIDVLEREGLANVPDPGPGPRPAHGPREGRRRRLSSRSVWLAVLVAGFVASLLWAGVGRRAVVNGGGWGLVGRFFAAAVHPELSGEFLRLTWDATLTTLSYAALGTALSVVVGVVGGVLASQTWWRSGRSPGRSGPGGRGTGRVGGGWLAARGALGVPRAIHEAIWALFLVNVLGRNPLVGVLAIALPYGAVTAKVYSELLDETPPAAFRALRGAGAGRLTALAYSLGPQALPDLVSYAFYRFECSIRAATILGFIGAGGLGFQLLLSFQSLRYPEMWTVLYVLILVSGLADLWSRRLRARLIAATPRSGLHGRRDPTARYSRAGGRPRRDPLLTGSLVLAAALVLGSAWHLGVDVATLWAGRTWSLLGDVASSTFPPRLEGAALAKLARLTVETLAMAVVATVLATTAAMVVAFVAARRGPVSLVARAVLLACRAIPPPVWALLFLFVLFPGPLPGAMALAVYNFGILGRLMAEVVENLDPRPVRALAAQGASPGHSFLYGALPVALPRFAAYGLYRWEVTTRETVVVGLVGAGGLGSLLLTQLASFDYRGVVVTLAALVVLTFVVDVAGAALRRALR
ncbi:MAG: ABC transporter permease subunit [Actinomycetota bacterium]|nr:ABC transporter permease subunit [Actinomycetota bacterium]